MPYRIPDSYVPDKVRGFIDGLVWCKDEYKDVLTMALLVSYIREAFSALPEILATGVHGVAVLAAFCLADDPAGEAAALRRVVDRFHPENV